MLIFRATIKDNHAFKKTPQDAMIKDQPWQYTISDFH